MGFFGDLVQGTVRLVTMPFVSRGRSIVASQRARDNVEGTRRSEDTYVAVQQEIDRVRNNGPTIGGTAASGIQAAGGHQSNPQQQQVNDEFFGRGNITGNPQRR